MQTSLNCVYAPRWPLREAQSGWSAKAWCVKHTRPGVVSELFFFFFCWLQSVLVPQLCEVKGVYGGGGGGGQRRQSLLKVDTRLTWSLSVCLLRVRGDKREWRGRLCSQNNWSNGEAGTEPQGSSRQWCEGIVQEGFCVLCFFFQTSPHSQPCTHAKWKTLLMRCSFQSTVLIMNSWICIWYQSERMGVLCYR